MALGSLGMGLRAPSQVVMSEDEMAAAEAARQQGFDDQRARLKAGAQRQAARLGQMTLDQTRAGGRTITDQQARNLLPSLTAAFDYGTGFNATGEMPGFLTPQMQSIWSTQQDKFATLGGLGAKQTQSALDFQGAKGQRAQAQQVQQSAYDANQTGAPGGVLASVAAKGTADPLATMPTNQPWSTPGFGAPGGLGGLGGYKPQGQGAQPSGGSGWGGIFANRNPWSFA